MSTPIKTLSFDQIYNLCNELGQPRYRADQLISWLFVKQANNYDEMSNLPKAFRATLAEDYPLVPARLIDRQVSSDGTRKYCFELADGALRRSCWYPFDANQCFRRTQIAYCLLLNASRLFYAVSVLRYR